MTLSTRLESLVHLLADRGRIIDVGTDHAYLPIYLASQDESRHILACDLRTQPLARARDNIRAAGLESQIQLIQTDGLDGIELMPDDCIVMSGLGGLEMSNILSRIEPHLGQTIVCQANWTWVDLRDFLAAHGYRIVREELVEDKGYTYCNTKAEFVGIRQETDLLQSFVGPDIIRGIRQKRWDQQGRDLYTAYLAKLTRMAEQKSMQDAVWSDIASRIRKLSEDLGD